jgi:hypothetical protein
VLGVKRHPAFQDLSRDHFTALNRSLQVIRAVEGHASARPYEEARAAFVALWRTEGLPAHFLEEEHDLVPVLRSKGGPDLADRLLREHDDLRGRLEAVATGAASPQQAAEAARGLMAHARWEEDTVFEWLQDNLDEAALADLLQRGRSFRQDNGLPVGPAC